MSCLAACKLACRCTGAGKTLISVLLVKAKHWELGAGGARKVTVFLAPKVGLPGRLAETREVVPGNCTWAEAKTLKKVVVQVGAFALQTDRAGQCTEDSLQPP